MSEEQPSPMEELLGKFLLTDAKGTKKKTDELIKDDTEFVLLYFSASWCPPCKMFSPILIDFYKENSAGASKFEVIYVSSDRSQEDFEAYYGKMPWLAVPTDKEGQAIMDKLSSSLKIRGIPTLVVLQAKTGLVVSSKGREEVQSYSQSGRTAFLFQEWKKAKGITIAEIAKPIEDKPLGFVPMMILLAYILWWIWRYMTKGPAEPDELEQVFGNNAIGEDKEF